jgi:hypothetical protein
VTGQRVQAASKGFLPFEEAREYAWKLELKGQKQWQEWSRDGHRPSDIPSNPQQTYVGKG